MGNWSDYILKLFQSTLPRRERPRLHQREHNLLQISIHTPTKGATRILSQKRFYDYISIHTPTKGATDIGSAKFTFTLFQSTLPRRERRIPVRDMLGDVVISIHTPTKGATGNNGETAN